MQPFLFFTHPLSTSYLTISNHTLSTLSTLTLHTHSPHPHSISTRSRNRTGTVLPPLDFESSASTSSAIRADALHPRSFWVGKYAESFPTPPKAKSDYRVAIPIEPCTTSLPGQWAVREVPAGPALP